MTSTSRLGVFFVVIGIALIALYLASDAARMTQCGLLLGGMALVILGISLWRKGTPHQEPVEHFRTAKRLLTSSSRKNKKR